MLTVNSLKRHELTNPYLTIFQSQFATATRHRDRIGLGFRVKCGLIFLPHRIRNPIRIVNKMNNDPPPVFSTFIVMTVMICMFSLMTEAILVGCHLFFGKIPGDNPVAHYLLLTVACLSSGFVRLYGWDLFVRTGQREHPLHLTGVQSVLVTLLVISYSIFVGWTFGLFN